MISARITHIGGPTTLIEIAGWRLLTDPTFDAPGRRYSFGWGTSSRKLAGPAVPAQDLGRIDAVLLSHDHHDDNLDSAGRALLPAAGTVVTTSSGAQRLGGATRGLRAWDSTLLEADDRPTIRVTATPCRHGPPLSHPIVGDVIGFAVRAGDDGTLWISGDTVLYPGVREVADRVDVDIALIHLGGVQFPVTGPLRYTMTARQAVELCRLVDPRLIVPVHYEGWKHFREGRSAIEREFAAAPEVQSKVRWLELGAADRRLAVGTEQASASLRTGLDDVGVECAPVHRPSPHRVFAALALCVGAALGPLVPAAGAAAPGLVDTKLATPASNPLSAPTTIVPILNTGRAFILEKGGAVRILSADGTVVSADALNLGVCTDSEEGLLGIAADPGFAGNGFVYVYYTRNAGNCASSTGRFNRVSRFKMVGDPLTSNTIDLASEVPLLDNMNIPAGNHNGGDLNIGNDGELYVTVGDGGSNPRGTSGVSAGRDLSLLNGKILRITTTGGVPIDNPLVGQSGAQPCAMAGIGAPTTAKCTEIYDYGLRNPYRFAFDPNTMLTRFFINDVGEGTWEEVDLGGRGLDYGWNVREGFCVAGSSSNCGSTPPQFTDPLTAYNHSIGCTFVTAGAFIPNGVWASTYDGGYLFGDGGCGKVFFMNAAGAVDYSQPFAQTSGSIVDMAFLTQGGQTGLYYVTNSSGELHRITLPAGPGPPPPPTTTPTTPAPPTTPTTSTTPVTPGGGGSPSHSATRCTIPSVRGLLASAARARLVSHHCKVHQIVVKMRAGHPVKTKHGAFVRAKSSAKPVRSPGRHRVWTLRVERVSPKASTKHADKFRVTIWVGWEATRRLRP